MVAKNSENQLFFVLILSFTCLSNNLSQLLGLVSPLVNHSLSTQGAGRYGLGEADFGAGNLLSLDDKKAV